MTDIGRIPLLAPAPLVSCGRWPAKAFSGEVVPFSVTSFRDGHDLIGVRLLLTAPDGTETSHPLNELSPGSDRWGAEVRLDTEGAWSYVFEAYGDDLATWRHAAAVKIDAGVDVEVMYAVGADLLRRTARETDRPPSERRYLSQLATRLGKPGKGRRELIDDERLVSLAVGRPLYRLSSRTEPLTIRVERDRAGTGSWYEFFPRSIGAKRKRDGTWASGTFRTAEKALPRIAEMGFDVVYLPPIHPIGRAFRKGRNNTLDAGPNDPGSPWAVGAAEGGHDAVHPDLGTLDDFRRFVRRAESLGLEVALDLALQASPDHPWVAEHPEWFTTLPDGTIAYAENPPKKYQDIYPVNFDDDPEGLLAEVLRIVRHWMSCGVRIFRVDNPHTKPVAFWERLIGEINAEDPGVVFLAEAFTRPAMMQALARVGFQQSYSYFTWRNTKDELEEFLTSVSTETADFLRPNLFVNTPDILTEYLQFGGPAAATIRAAIAATAAPLWGVYSGFELFEFVARPGSEENIDNEKYEYKPRDFPAADAAGASLSLFLGILNGIRRSHPALRQLRNLHIHASEDDAVLVYSKHLSSEFTGTGSPDTVIVVANVDPHSVRETTVHLDLEAIGIRPGSTFTVHDLVTDAEWQWSGDDYVRLDAFTSPVHILEVVEVTDDRAV